VLGLVLGGVATFVLSLIVACKFLRMRCRGIGPPFGPPAQRLHTPRPRARRWALFIVLSTAIVSTAVGLLIAVGTGSAPAALIGVAVSGGLWFAKVPPQRDLDMLPRTPSSVLTRPFSLLYERMGEDQQEWCDIRCEAAKPKPQYIADAAEYYWNQTRRVSDPQHRSRLDRWRESIVHKISLVRLIDLDAGPRRLADSLQQHISTANTRRYNDDDQDRLARRLETEALNELHLFLAYAYRLGYHNMLIYPFRVGTYRPEPPPPGAQPPQTQPVEPIAPDL
jgi:hypothetical protein